MISPNEQIVVELGISDLARSLAFYAAIGFEVRRVEARFAELAWNGHLLLLQVDPSPASGANVRILVEDVDARWEKVHALGAPIVMPIRNARYGLRDFIFTDPDGNQLRFAQVITVDPTLPS